MLMSRTAALLVCLLILLTLSPRGASADDEQLWAALKQGGKVILLRHTDVDIREGIGRLAPGNCAEEVNLSSRGVEQAKRHAAANKPPRKARKAGYAAPDNASCSTAGLSDTMLSSSAIANQIYLDTRSAAAISAPSVLWM